MKKAEQSNSKIQVTDKNEEQRSDNKIIITIAREYGSGGRYIGKLVAEKLGIKLYDKEIIEKIAETTGLSEEYIKDNEQKRNALDNFNNGYYTGLNNSDELFIKESELIKSLASKGSCVIVGRCADFILKDEKNILKVFINSSMNNKIKRATEFYGMNENKAKKEIIKINKLRANHYKYYTDKNWSDPSNYDVCINSDSIGIDNTVNLICNMVNFHTKSEKTTITNF